MKPEEIFLMIASWFIGMLGLYAEVSMHHITGKQEPFIFYISLIFFIFSIYFSLKYSGLLTKGGAKNEKEYKASGKLQRK